MTPHIVAERPDVHELDKLYAAAFPDEPLTGLVGALTALDTSVLSLAARIDGALAGHGLFTMCKLEEAGEAALLGPLAVAPDHQRQGVGGAIIRAGIDRLRGGAARRILVLGDPAYYSRFGFTPERDVRPTHPIPAAWKDAWRSITLDARPASGRLIAPAAWDDPALWS